VKIMITGANGQLGDALQKTSADFIAQQHAQIIALTRAECDLAQPHTIAAVLDNYTPTVIINAAAYTAVDKAESDAELAYQVNAESVKQLAIWAQQRQVPLIQVSTDFIFDGQKASPYKVDDAANPLGAYGQTKLQGEAFALGECETAYVVRTGWVYSEHGNNFVKTILRLAREREQLTIIADQVGTPTYAHHLAQMIWQLLALRPAQKIWHFSDAGVASWYDFAVAIVDEAVKRNLLERAPVIRPITTADYPTPARRPSYSVLDKTASLQELDLVPVHWRSALVSMLQALAHTA
jgi:dTDP-4-dehydrorhamnose reductase